MRLSVLPAAFLISILFCQAQEPPSPGPAVKKIADGVLDLGGVRVDKNARTVSFPVVVNMNDGLIEYLLVGKGGKTHESLLSTEIKPYYVHLAMLLIGAKGNPHDPSLEKSGPPPSAINASYLRSAPPMKGDDVEMSVRWKSGDQDRVMNVEDFVINDQQKLPMRHGLWTYNGSMFYNGKFLAELDNSIASMVTDPEALINNRQPGHDNDQIWEIDRSRTPPLNTPLMLTIQLENPKTP